MKALPFDNVQVCQAIGLMIDFHISQISLVSNAVVADNYNVIRHFYSSNNKAVWQFEFYRLLISQKDAVLFTLCLVSEGAKLFGRIFWPAPCKVIPARKALGQGKIIRGGGSGG